MKEKLAFKMMKRSGLALAMMAGAATLLSSCVDPSIYGQTPNMPTVVNQDGLQYKRALELAVSQADRITVQEHSHWSDFSGFIEPNAKAPSYSYGTRDLTAEQKNAFLIDVQRLRGTNKAPVANCLFVPHHTIRFYEQGHLKSTMRVCYKCNEVKWNGTQYSMPSDLFFALTPTIKRVGFEPEKSWDAMAKSRYTPPAPKPKPGPPTAKRIANKPGFVTNPFTGNEVDVDGIPSGTKVRDPHDPDETHIFRVP